MYRLLLSGLLVLGCSTCFAGDFHALRVTKMQNGQVYDIQTAGRVYRAKMVDCKTGECLMQATSETGAFKTPRKVFILGATPGPQAGFTLVSMGEIKVGIGMELAIGNHDAENRFLTAPVIGISSVDSESNAVAVSPASRGGVE